MRALSVAASAVLALACGGPESGRSGAKPTIDLQGHRGARGLAPENTLAGFERALAIGVTTLELDVGMTADGVLVVSHDPELGPELTRHNGRYLVEPVAIRTLDLAALRAYDVGRIAAGTAYATRFPEQRAVDGAGIPTLVEVFELGDRLSGGTIRYNVETKLDPRRRELTASPEAMTEALLAVIEERGLGNRVTIQSFDWSSLAIAGRRAPGIERVCLTTEREDDTVEVGKPGASPWLGGVDVDDHGSVAAAARAAGCAVWSPNYRDLDAQKVRDAQRRGLRVVPWTVNGDKDIGMILDLGVDGVISDYPNRVRAELGRRGLPLPTPFRP